MQGSIVALITPMHEDGSIDYENFEKLIDWHSENKTDGLVVLGTTGESPTIEACERRELIRCAVARARHKMPVIVGTGSNSTQQTIAQTQEAMSLGADAVLLVTPYYNKPTQEGLYQHYKIIAKTVSIPQILYNVPSRTCCDLLPETIARLTAFPNIIAVKEATGDLNRLKKLLSMQLPIDYFTGSDDNNMEFILMGGRGSISVLANVVPQLMQQLCALALAGNREAASKISAQLADLCGALFIETNPIPTKWILEKMSLIRAGIRLPLTSLSPQHHSHLEKLIRQF